MFGMKRKEQGPVVEYLGNLGFVGASGPGLDAARRRRAFWRAVRGFFRRSPSITQRAKDVALRNSISR